MLEFCPHTWFVYSAWVASCPALCPKSALARVVCSAWSSLGWKTRIAVLGLYHTCTSVSQLSFNQTIVTQNSSCCCLSHNHLDDDFSLCSCSPAALAVAAWADPILGLSWPGQHCYWGAVGLNWLFGCSFSFRHYCKHRRSQEKIHQIWKNRAGVSVDHNSYSQWASVSSRFCSLPHTTCCADRDVGCIQHW